MAFYKKVKQKINGLWYPRSVTVGKPISTDQIADRLSQISSLSRGDTYSMLKDLPTVLSDYMAQGHTIKLEGLGTFYYTAIANGNGVDSPEKVKASQISGVRVRFIPETKRTASNQVSTRSLVSTAIPWEEWGGTNTDDEEVEDPGTGSGNGGTGGGGGGNDWGEAPDPGI